MAKINKPLLSLSAIGTLGKHLVFRKRGSSTVAQLRPLAMDARSAAQLQWRTMYQKAVALWHLLSPAEKASWERQATPLHMIGFAYFISQALKPNPGIYLPLSGGAMSGDIDMATNKILNLPAPTADEEPTRKSDLATHAALEAAIHGLQGEVAFSAYQTSNQTVLAGVTTILNWDTEEYDIGSYFDLVNNRYQPAIPGKYCIILGCEMLNFPADYCFLTAVRKNGTTYKIMGRQIPAAVENPFIGMPCIVPLNGSTDYIDAFVYSYAPTTQSTFGDPFRTFFQGFLIAQS